MNQALNNLKTLLLAGILLSTAFALTLRKPSAILLTALSAWYLFFLAPAVWTAPLKEYDQLEKGALTIIYGFFLGSAYFIADVLLRIPLTTATYIIIPLLATITGIIYWRKEYFMKKETMHHQPEEKQEQKTAQQDTTSVQPWPSE